MDEAMKTDRFLIINADDFGMSPGINRGIVRAFEDGVVTSASLMVRWPSTAQAARYARAHPRLGLGLHLDLGEWALRGGRWVPIYEVVRPDDDVSVRAEFRRQLDRFLELVGRDPDHLDSHQHVHREGPAWVAASELASGLGVPLRHARPGVHYCGGFYGQDDEGEPYPKGIALENLARLIEGIAPGSTEIACHPGEVDGLETMYRTEREQEVRTLCDPRVREVVRRAGIMLLTFRDVGPDGNSARIDRPAMHGERPRRAALQVDSV
jgi:predicted glycoside hydrolase/deacetylase ChbG (UPF0249 family)